MCLWNFVILFSYFVIVSPSLKQSWTSFTLGYFVLCLVETGPVVLEKKDFLKVVSLYLSFSNYLPMGKGMTVNEETVPKNDLCPVWLNWLNGSEEKDENVTSLQTNKLTDDGRSEKYTWAFSSYKLNFKQKYYKNCTLKDKYPSF